MLAEPKEDINPHESESWRDKSLECLLIPWMAGFGFALHHFSQNIHITCITTISVFFVLVFGHRVMNNWKPRLYSEVNFWLAGVIILVCLYADFYMYNISTGRTAVHYQSSWFLHYWLGFSAIFGVLQVIGIFRVSKYDVFPELCTVENCEYCLDEPNDKVSFPLRVIFSLVMALMITFTFSLMLWGNGMEQLFAAFLDKPRQVYYVPFVLYFGAFISLIGYCRFFKKRLGIYGSKEV
jgi:hypothetical protein